MRIAARRSAWRRARPSARRARPADQCDHRRQRLAAPRTRAAVSVLAHLDDLRRACDRRSTASPCCARCCREGPLAGQDRAGLLVRRRERRAARHGRDRRSGDPGDLPRHRQAVRRDPGLSRGAGRAAAASRDVRVVRPRAAALARHDPGGELWQPRARPVLPHPQDRAAARRRSTGFAAWITGRKRFQAGLRSQLPTIEAEPVERADQAQPAGALVGRRRRALPAAAQPAGSIRWSTEGYRSIGCVTCTRPVARGRGAARGPLVGPRQDRVRHSPRGRGGVSGRSSSLPEFAPGSVWLVGAGPGDPGLLTLHAAHALALRRRRPARRPGRARDPGAAPARPRASSRSASAPGGRARRSSGSTSA